MNPEQDMHPVNPENPPGDQTAAGSEAMPPQTDSAPLAQAEAWYRKPWLWLLLAVLVVLAVAGAYLTNKYLMGGTDNSAVSSTSTSSASAGTEDPIEGAATEPITQNPYEGWNTFTSRVDGFSFKYPVSMRVEETLPTDKNDQGYDEGFMIITVREAHQGNGMNEYAFRISDLPWGCVGDGTAWEPMTYDVSIGDQPVTLTDSCNGFFTAVKLSNDRKSTLTVNRQYLLQDKGEFSLILGSMTGVTLTSFLDQD